MTKREYVGAFIHHWGTALIGAALVSVVLGPVIGVAFGAVLGAVLGVKVVRNRRYIAEVERNEDRMLAGLTGRPRLAEVTRDASILDDPPSGHPVEAAAG